MWEKYTKHKCTAWLNIKWTKFSLPSQEMQYNQRLRIPSYAPKICEILSLSEMYDCPHSTTSIFNSVFSSIASVSWFDFSVINYWSHSRCSNMFISLLIIYFVCVFECLTHVSVGLFFNSFFYSKAMNISFYVLKLLLWFLDPHLACVRFCKAVL